MLWIQANDKYVHSGLVTIKAQVFTFQSEIDRQTQAAIESKRMAWNAAYEQAHVAKRELYLSMLSVAKKKNPGMLKTGAKIGLNQAPKSVLELDAAHYGDEKNKLNIHRMATSVLGYADNRWKTAHIAIYFRAEGLPKMDTFGWCDAYLEFFRHYDPAGPSRPDTSMARPDTSLFRSRSCFPSPFSPRI